MMNAVTSAGFTTGMTIVKWMRAFWTNTGANFIYTESQKGFAYVVGQLASGKVAGVGASFVGISSASSVLMFAVPLVVFLIMQNNVVSTMATSGMKE